MLLINSRKVMMYKVGSKILNYLPSEDINSSMISPLIDPAGNKFDKSSITFLFIHFNSKRQLYLNSSD